MLLLSYFCFRKLNLPATALEIANEGQFELAGYGFDAIQEQTRASRIVRVGIIQNKIVLPTTSPILEQVIHLPCLKPLSFTN